MRKIGQLTFASCLLLLASGCVYALAVQNPEHRVKMKIGAQSPTDYCVVVAEDQLRPFCFDESGQVEFTVPPLETGCRVYFLGILKVADHSAAGRRAMCVYRNKRLVARLSLRDIERLPIDSDGYRLLKAR